jgi:hypothetical protein
MILEYKSTIYKISEAKMTNGQNEIKSIIGKIKNISNDIKEMASGKIFVPNCKDTRISNYKATMPDELKKHLEELSGPSGILWNLSGVNNNGAKPIKEKSKKIGDYASKIDILARKIGSFARNPNINSGKSIGLDDIGQDLVNIMGKEVNTKEKARQIAKRIGNTSNTISSFLSSYEKTIEWLELTKLEELNNKLKKVAEKFNELASSDEGKTQEQVNNALAKIKLPEIGNSVTKP